MRGGTTIYVKTYKYKDVLNIKKELVSEEPDEDGNYTLKFTVNAKDLPAISSATRNETVLVIDASLSMACATDFEREDGGAEYMADTYAKTRWKAMYDAVNSFLDEFLPEGNTKNTIALVIYNETAEKIIETPTASKTVVMENLDKVFNENNFNDSLASSKKNTDGKIKVDDMTSKGKLLSKTNVKAGLDSAAEIFSTNNNTDAKSIILFTDGVANRPNTNVTTEDITQYTVGIKYTYKDKEYTISNVSYDSKYYVDNVKVGESTELEAAYYANQKGQKLADDNVTIYSFALIDNVTDNVRAALGNKNINMSEYVSKEKTHGKNSSIELTISPNFTYTNEGTGYAKKFYATTSADDLKKEFSNIIASLKELPFESASVTDKLDSHFQLVSDQNGVNDNGDGTFTVKYSDSHIKTEAQTITVKIKAKEGYAGYSYTNDGCRFYGEVDGLTYEQKFTDEPAAVIKPDAVKDEYTVNQDEELTVNTENSVLKNDRNERVDSPDGGVSIKAEKISEPEHGKVTFNEDGTFTYEPEEGFSGVDTFTYNTVLTVKGKDYKKSETVTITVVPKYTQTIKYQYADGTKAADDNVQTVVKGNSTTAVASPVIKDYKMDTNVVEAKQLTDNEVITVVYSKDESQTVETPTETPTQKPTEAPTQKPTEAPTQKPTEAPTQKPTEAPTQKPTEAPTQKPTETPTQKPTEAPTQKPTEAPTQKPTEAPTQKPTEAPTQKPTEAPTQKPTEAVTEVSTQVSTEESSSDDSQTNVKTGDDSSLMLYVIMIAAGAAGTATVAVTGRRKKSEQ